jgi:hypothetical protein
VELHARRIIKPARASALAIVGGREQHVQRRHPRAPRAWASSARDERRAGRVVAASSRGPATGVKGTAHSSFG